MFARISSDCQFAIVEAMKPAKPVRPVSACDTVRAVGFIRGGMTVARAAVELIRTSTAAIPHRGNLYGVAKTASERVDLCKNAGACPYCGSLEVASQDLPYTVSPLSERDLVVVAVMRLARIGGDRKVIAQTLAGWVNDELGLSVEVLERMFARSVKQIDGVRILGMCPFCGVTV